MDELTTHHLLFHAEVNTPLELDERSGSALRGQLYEAVWRRFCTNHAARTCVECSLNSACPVSALVAPLREESARGRDIPRPYLIVPPLKGARHLAPGETFAFGLTLFGRIVDLLPYVLLSLPTLEAVGLGKRGQDGKRGQFTVKRVESYHPLSGERRSIYEAGKARVDAATLSVTTADVQAKAAGLARDRITLEFLTPTRIKDQERPIGHAEFRPLIHRLLERLSALRVTYGGSQEQSYEERKHLVDLAQHVRCLNDATYWEQLKSYSHRTHESLSIGGLLGRATFGGDLTPFLETLVWGELIHIGKNCVKGNGWYTIVA